MFQFYSNFHLFISEFEEKCTTLYFLQQENKQSLVKMLGDVQDDMVHNIYNHSFYEIF